MVGLVRGREIQAGTYVEELDRNRLLLTDKDKETYSRAIQLPLKGKLEPVNKVLTTQDFRHISQG